MARVDFKFLRSKVARRIFLLFVCCALLPILALTFISFESVSQQLAEQSRRQLQRASKTEGMEEYARLTGLETELRILAMRLGTGRKPRLGELFRAAFRNAASFSPHGEVREVLLGQPLRLPVFDSGQEKHLAEGNSLLVVRPCV